MLSKRTDGARHDAALPGPEGDVTKLRFGKRVEASVRDCAARGAQSFASE